MFRFFRHGRVSVVFRDTLLLAGFIIAVLQAPETMAQSLEEGAKREGELLIYSGLLTPELKMIGDAFMKKYPFVRVESVRTAGANLLQKVLAEKAGGKIKCDFIQMVGSLAEDYKEHGILAKYVSPESKNYPEGFRDPEGYWTALYSTYKFFIYNTKMIAEKDVPKTHEDLLNPLWKRQIGIGRNEFDWYIGMLDFLGEEKGRQFMKRLGDQELRVYAGASLATQLLIAGEFPLALSLQNLALDSIKAGGHLGVLTSLPAITVPRCMGIAAGSPHPNAAKLMVDFLLSIEGQVLLNKIGYTSIRPGVKKDQALEALNLNLYPFRPRPSKQMEVLIKEYRKILLKQ